MLSGHKARAPVMKHVDPIDALEAAVAAARARRRPPEVRSCRACQKEFSSDNPQKAFCSTRCKSGGRKPREKKCLGCNKLFQTSIEKKLYCDKACRPKSGRPRGERAPGYVSPGSLGAARELIVCSDLLLRGYAVFRSISPNSPCDLIAAIEGKLVRIEVTTGSRSPAGTLVWPLHDPATYDVLALVMADRQVIYLPDPFVAPVEANLDAEAAGSPPEPDSEVCDECP